MSENIEIKIAKLGEKVLRKKANAIWGDHEEE